MKSRLSVEEATGMLQHMSKEYDGTPIKLKHRVNIHGEKIWGVYISDKKKFLFIKWFSFRNQSAVESHYLEDLVDEFAKQLEKWRTYVDPRWDNADRLREKYATALLDKELRK
jgi:hypothetical protein